MKNLCLVIFFSCLWVCNSLEADTKNGTPLTTNQQIVFLKSQIRQFSEKNHDSTIVYAERLRKVAEEDGNDEEVAYSLVELSWAHKKKGNLNQSIRYYFELDRLYQRLGNTAGRGATNLNIGQILAKGYEFDKALNYLELAKAYYGETGQFYNVSKTLYEMGKRYIEKKDPATATIKLEEALNTCPDTIVSHLSMIYNRLGWAAKDQGEYEKARNYYNEAITVLNNTEICHTKKAIAHNNIGETYLLEGKLESAIKYFEKAMKIKNDLDNPESSLETLTQLARLFYKKGQIKEAIERLDQGIENMAPGEPNVKMAEALALVTQIANDPANKTPLPYWKLTRYMSMQQQQLTGLQELKEQLNKTSDQYHIQMGVTQDEIEQQQRTFHATIHERTYWWSSALAIISAFAVGGFVYASKQKREKLNVLKDKDDFVNEQVKNYDQRILQMLIVKAEYEEMKARLKKDFGLGDEDFT